MPHREIRDEVFAHAVGQVLGVSVALRRLERHDCDRRPGGGRGRGGQCLARKVDEVRVDRLRDVLDVLRADVLECLRGVDFVSNDIRDADATRPGQTLETCGDVDPGAVDPVTVDHDLTAVHPDPELHPVRGLVLLVRLLHERLEPERCRERGGGILELEQEVVARRVDQPAAVLHRDPLTCLTEDLDRVDRA